MLGEGRDRYVRLRLTPISHDIETETETEKSPCIRLSLTVSKVIRMLPTVTGIGC